MQIGAAVANTGDGDILRAVFRGPGMQGGDDGRAHAFQPDIVIGLVEHFEIGFLNRFQQRGGVADRGGCSVSAMVSTASREAVSPPRAPPMPSANRNRPISGRTRQ